MFRTLFGDDLTASIPAIAALLYCDVDRTPSNFVRSEKEEAVLRIKPKVGAPPSGLESLHTLMERNVGMVIPVRFTSSCSGGKDSWAGDIEFHHRRILRFQIFFLRL